MNDVGVAHTDVSLRVNRRSESLPLDSSSTFGVWVGEFSGSLSAVRQMLVDVPPPQFLLASQKMSSRHHTSLVEGLTHCPPILRCRLHCSVMPPGQGSPNGKSGPTRQACPEFSKGSHKAREMRRASLLGASRQGSNQSGCTIRNFYNRERTSEGTEWSG